MRVDKCVGPCVLDVNAGQAVVSPSNIDLMLVPERNRSLHSAKGTHTGFGACRRLFTVALPANESVGLDSIRLKPPLPESTPAEYADTRPREPPSRAPMSKALVRKPGESVTSVVEPGTRLLAEIAKAWGGEISRSQELHQGKRWPRMVSAQHKVNLKL